MELGELADQGDAAPRHGLGHGREGGGDAVGRLVEHHGAGHPGEEVEALAAGAGLPRQEPLEEEV